MNRTLRTSLGQVRGLGAAREGAHHFIVQRVSAIALLFLAPWFLISLMVVVSGGYDGAIAWISQPLNAVLILVAISTALYHMRLGMQVVIEDYIARSGTRAALLILNTFIPVFLFASAVFAVMKIAG
jgi:succinate dehydrogenase / fumarate reductase membrane anchor subunit